MQARASGDQSLDVVEADPVQGIELIKNGQFTEGVNPWEGHWGGTTGLNVKDDATVGKYLEVDKKSHNRNSYYMVKQTVSGKFRVGDMLHYSYKVRSGSAGNNLNTRFNIRLPGPNGNFPEDDPDVHVKIAGPRVQGEWVTVTGTYELWANTDQICFGINEDSFSGNANNIHIADVSVLYVEDTTSVPVTGIELNKDTLTLPLGAKEELTANVKPDDATRKGVVWTTSDLSVAKVDSKGLVTAAGVGTATITATSAVDKSIKAECAVTVNEIPVTGIALNSSELSLEPGVTGTLRAEIQPSNATNKIVNWNTSDEKVATVDNGVVTAVAVGTATITASSDEDPEKKAECEVTVTTEKVAATEVTLDSTSLSMKAGTTRRLNETVLPANATNKNIIWNTSNPSVAAVEDGMVTAVTAGTVMITATLATDPSKRAECIVTVTGSILEKTLGANPYLPLWEHLPDGEPNVFEDPDNPGKYRAYIIGSHDTRRSEYCGPDVRAWSAPVEDLTQWRDEGPIFSHYVNNQWDLIYAPDIVEVRRRDENGDRTIKEYYLYPHSRGGGRLSMVCKGDSPVGPFTPINLNEAGTATLSGSLVGFDPAVLVDYIDDPEDPDYEIGFRAYAYWGWQEAEACELDQNNMWAVRPGTQRIHDFIPCSSSYGNIRKPDIEYPYVYPGEDLKSFNYFEAFEIRKVGNKYVLTFSGYSGPDYGMGSTNSALRYAYGDTPLGPWKSGGVLVDSRGPVLNEEGTGLVGRTWAHNTHGGLQQINDQWYVFYHRPPRGNAGARQAVVAPVKIDWDEKSVADGGKVSIKAYDPYSEDNTWTAKDSQGREYTGAEITSEGFNLYGLDPYKYYSAGIASYVDGGTLQDSYEIWDSHMPIENVRNNARIGYKYFGFEGIIEDQKGVKAFEGTKPGNNTKFNVFLTPKTTESFKVNVWLDGPWSNETWKGTKIGEIVVPAGSAQETQRFQIDVADAVDNLDGKHAVFLVAEGGNGNLFDLIGLGFSSDTKEIERPIMPELGISINGQEMELPRLPIASDKNGINGICTYDMYDVYPPSGLTSVPEIEAYASDDNVKITISKPSSLSGVGYVRFEMDGKTKTYRIAFSDLEYTVFEEMPVAVTSVEAAADIIGDMLLLDGAEDLTDEQKAAKAKETIDEMLQSAAMDNESIKDVVADVAYVNGAFELKLTCGDTVMTNSAFAVTAPITVVPVAEVTMDQKTISLEEGKKAVLKAAVAPDNATIQELVWSTSNESVATVNNGVVTAVAPGRAAITAVSFSDNTKKAVCSVTVPGETAGIELIKNGQFTEGVSPWVGHWGGAGGLSVKEDDTVGQYLEVDKRGNNWNTFYMVRQDVQGDFRIGDVLKYSYKVRSGSAGNNQNTRFNIIIPNENGNFNGTEDVDKYHKKIAGPRVQGEWVTVTGTCEIWEDTNMLRLGINEDRYGAPGNNVHLADVSVVHVQDTTSIRPTGIELNKETLTLTPGAKEELTAVVKPDDATRKDVTWSTSDASVAKVDNKGMVTAVGVGTATITVTSNFIKTVKAECAVTVNPIAVTEVSLNETELSLEPGAKGTLRAEVKPSNATNKDVEWSTSDKKVATVNNGVVTAVAVGKATITVASVSNPEKKAECTITVTNEKVAATEVKLSSARLSMDAGAKKTLIETVLPANSTNKNVEWSSSNPSVAAVKDGVVSAVTAGTVMITAKLATDPSKRADCLVTVTGSILEKTLGANPYLPLWEHLPDGEPNVFEDPDNPGKYRAYIIGSHDLRRNEYCGPDVRAWSAPVEDLTQWRDEGPIFSHYVNNQWDLIYAPDIVEVRRRDENGDRTIKEYYLYPHSRGGGRLSMVCKGDSPVGPFTPINLNEAGTATLSGSLVGFDPAVLVDYIDDPEDPDYEIGFRAYAYWGWQEAEACELDQNNMWAVRPGTQRIHDFIPCSSSYGNIRKPDIEYPYVYPGEDLKSFNYFEAFEIRKVGNKYVLTFSGYSGPDYGMGSTNSALRYAYGDTPLGPWKSGGVLVDSRGPVLNEEGTGLVGRTWAHNTHGGLQQINDQWYVFYHRPPRGNAGARQAVVAPVKIDWDEKSVADGGKVSIKAYDPYSEDNTWTAKDSQGREYTGAEITSEGFNLYGLDPYKYYSAGIASYVDGGTLQDSYEIWDSHMPIENVRNNAKIGYKYFGFEGIEEDQKGIKAFEGTKPGNNTKFNVFLTPKTAESFKVNVWLDGPWDNETWKGTKIGEIEVPAGSAQETQRFQLDVSKAVDNLDGKHAVFLVAEGGNGNLFDLIGLGFSSDTKEIERPIMPKLGISINGTEMELPNLPIASTGTNGISTYDMYDVYPPSGLTSVPEIEAYASDDSVKITVSKPASLDEIAYVRFEKDGKTKTYRIPFAKQQYTVFEELNEGIGSVETAAGIIGNMLIVDGTEELTNEQKAAKAQETIDEMLQKSVTENESLKDVVADVSYVDDSYVLKLTCGDTVMTNRAFSITAPVTMVPVTKVTVDKPVLSLLKGTKEKVNAVAAPEDATIKDVLWNTSDESIATVNNGVITAVAPGKATITVTSFSDNTKKAECIVTVNDLSPEEAAKQAAKEAKEAAEAAKAEADNAKADAENAKASADKAQQDAQAAEDSAATATDEAKKAADSAVTATEEAQKAADEAVKAKEEADRAQEEADKAAEEAGKSETARLAAEAAQKKAADAQAKAEAAQGKAEAAQTKAETAQTNAEAAQAKAEAAQGQAETAKADAETARTKAEEAKDKAVAAQSAAEKSADAAGVAQKAAESANVDAQAAKKAAEAARDQALKEKNEAAASAKAAADAKAQAEIIQGQVEAAKAQIETIKAEAVAAKTEAEAAKADAIAAKAAAEAAKADAISASADALAAKAAAEAAANAAAESAEAAKKAEEEAKKAAAEAAEKTKDAEAARIAAEKAQQIAEEALKAAQAAQAAAEARQKELDMAKQALTDAQKNAEKDSNALALTRRTAKIKSAKSPSKGRIKVLLNKDKAAAGYQIQYSQKKTFKGGLKTKTVKTTSYTLKSLKKNRTYYVRARAYTTDSKGKRVYSKWSKVRRVRVK